MPQPTSVGQAARPPAFDLRDVLTQAISALQTGDLNAAERFAEQAIRQAPENAASHLVMATVHQNLGQLDEAEGRYLECLRLDPNNPRALTNLGLLQLSREQPLEAVDTLERALDIDSNALEARHYLARAYGMCGRYRDAIDQFQLVEKKVPNSPEVLMGLGKALRASERTAEAIDALKKAHHLKRDDRRVCRDLGMNYAELGEFDEAERWLREAIRIAPFETDAYYQLSIIRRLSEDDVGAIQSDFAARQSVSDPIRASHEYAIGSFYDRRDNVERAFNALEKANAIMDARANFDCARITAHYGRLMEITDKTLLSDGPIGSSSEKPIFIVGMPRSGTTLVEQVLAGHPKVHAAGELETLATYAEVVMQQTSDRLLSVNELGPSELQQLASNYLGQFPAAAEAALRVTDKLPGNVAYLPLIARMFPNARIIVCRRHPMDIAWSIYKNSFSNSMAYATNLNHIAEVQKLTGDFMDRWITEMPDRSLEVLYEEVVDDFEAGARRIVSFAGLDWDDGCLATNAVSRSVRTASLWQVRQPVYNSSVSGWRRYRSQLAELEASMSAEIAAYKEKLGAAARPGH